MTPTATRAPGRTVAELATKIRKTDGETFAILLAFEKRGIVERGGGVWRLTEDADHAFGRALRMIDLDDAEGRAAS